MNEPWFRYDSLADALTLRVSAAESASTIEAGGGRLVDVDKDGTVVAVEVVDVSHGFALDDLAEKYGFERALRAVESTLPQQFYRQHT